jgi:Spy/CpxP family protein refolding chaperone
MRKRITLLIAAAITALTMSFGGATAAFADAPPWTGNDNQHKNKCTGGEKHQNCNNAQGGGG